MPLIKNKIKILISLLTICNLLIITYFSYRVSQQYDQLYVEFIETALEVEYIIDTTIQTSAASLATLAPKVTESDGDIARISSLINEENRRTGNNLRIAWSDKDALLKVGTSIGILEKTKSHLSAVSDKPFNLARRDYVQQAMAQPGQIHISAIHDHIFTGRKFFAIAIGVVDAQGNYLGCLASIVDVATLNSTLVQFLKDSDFSASITSPSNDALITIGRFDKAYTTQFQVTVDGFTVKTAIPTELRYALLKDNLYALLFVLLLINAVAIGAYRIYKTAFIKPLEEVHGHLATIPDGAINISSSSDVAKKVETITHLFHEHQAVKQQAEKHKRHLHNALQALQHTHEEQTTFLDSTSKEMEQIFQTLTQYTDYVEGNITEDYMHEEEAFFVNAKEVTLNLKYASNCLYIISQHKQGDMTFTPTEIDITENIVAALDKLEDHFEGHGIDLYYQPNNHIHVYHDAVLIQHIIWGAIYLAYTFVDSGKLVIESRSNATGSTITITGGRLNGRMPNPQEDISKFFMLEQRKVMQNRLDTHINAVVLRYFAEHFGGYFQAEIIEENGKLGLCIDLNLQAMEQRYPSIFRTHSFPGWKSFCDA